MKGEVTVRMDAPPEKVWALVSDVTRIGEFSPETFEAEWTRGSTGPEVGASFKGHVKRNGVGPTYWSPCQVTKCVPHEVARRHVAGESVIAEASRAKRTATDCATYVCDQAVQLHGGAGYLRGTEVERHYRDARILPIGGGATEVLTDLAAKLLGYAS